MPYDTPHGAMETTTISPSAPPAARARPLAAVRRYAGRWGLIAALAALPVYYGIHDLTVGYQAGVVAGHAVIRHDLSNLGFNFAVGLSKVGSAGEPVFFKTLTPTKTVS